VKRSLSRLHFLGGCEIGVSGFSQPPLFLFLSAFVWEREIFVPSHGPIIRPPAHCQSKSRPGLRRRRARGDFWQVDTRAHNKWCFITLMMDATRGWKFFSQPAQHQKCSTIQRLPQKLYTNFLLTRPFFINLIPRENIYFKV